MMLALAEYRSMTCTGCGGWLPETTAKDADEDYIAEGIHCHRCVAIAKTSSARGAMDRFTHLLRWRTRRRSTG